ncbi:hypothetical protein ACFLYU_05190, partial [Candidatus Dependentiae bacterium]
DDEGYILIDDKLAFAIFFNRYTKKLKNVEFLSYIESYCKRYKALILRDKSLLLLDSLKKELICKDFFKKTLQGPVKRVSFYMINNNIHLFILMENGFMFIVDLFSRVFLEVNKCISSKESSKNYKGIITKKKQLILLDIDKRSSLSCVKKFYKKECLDIRFFNDSEYKKSYGIVALANYGCCVVDLDRDLILDPESFVLSPCTKFIAIYYDSIRGSKFKIFDIKNKNTVYATKKLINKAYFFNGSEDLGEFKQKLYCMVRFCDKTTKLLSVKSKKDCDIEQEKIDPFKNFCAFMHKNKSLTLFDTIENKQICVFKNVQYFDFFTKGFNECFFVVKSANKPLEIIELFSGKKQNVKRFRQLKNYCGFLLENKDLMVVDFYTKQLIVRSDSVDDLGISKYCNTNYLFLSGKKNKNMIHAKCMDLDARKTLFNLKNVYKWCIGDGKKYIALLLSNKTGGSISIKVFDLEKKIETLEITSKSLLSFSIDNIKNKKPGNKKGTYLTIYSKDKNLVLSKKDGPFSTKNIGVYPTVDFVLHDKKEKDIFIIKYKDYPGIYKEGNFKLFKNQNKKQKYSFMIKLGKTYMPSGRFK